MSEIRLRNYGKGIQKILTLVLKVVKRGSDSDSHVFSYR